MERSLLFGCCYRPPHCDQSFYEYLEATLEKVAGLDILLTGDFNAKHTEWYSGDTVNSHGIAMSDLSVRFNLTQLCSEPTHLNRTFQSFSRHLASRHLNLSSSSHVHLNLAGKPESLLDLVLTNTPEYFHESARPMPPIGSSDHLPVVAKYQSIITKSKPATSSEYTKWLFPLKDVRKMDDAFLYDNWEHVFQPYNDIDQTWTRWKLAFLKDLELFIPKSTRKSHNRTPSAPWFSKELKQLIRRKNRPFKKAHASGSSDHWKAYCLERNKTTAAIKRAKSVHFNNQVNTLSDPNCSPSR